jgi:hypothetical protein
MQCADVADLLLTPDDDVEGDLDLHVASCVRCGQLARGVVRLNAVLASALVVEPPLDLQRQLASIALEAAQPRPAPWWRRAFPGEFKLDWLTVRPNVVAAQGLATLMVALASWQIYGWVNAFRPVIGDVGYAMELVAASPATAYLGGLNVDLQNLGLWSVVGVVAWLVSENGAIGQRVAALTDRFKLP